MINNLFCNAIHNSKRVTTKEAGILIKKFESESDTISLHCLGFFVTILRRELSLHCSVFQSSLWNQFEETIFNITFWQNLEELTTNSREVILEKDLWFITKEQLLELVD